MHIVYKNGGYHSVEIIRLCTTTKKFNDFMYELRSKWDLHEKMCSLQKSIRSRVFSLAREEITKKSIQYEKPIDMALYRVNYRIARDTKDPAKIEEALNELNRVIVQNSKITKTNNNIAKANNVTTQDIQAHADIMAKFLQEEEKAAYFYNANANDIHDPSRVGVCKVKANEDIKVDFGITY